MHESSLSISKKSTWLTATPTASVMTLPFYVTEAGCFYSNSQYYTKRSENDSFLLLYTISGKGHLETKNRSIPLLPGSAILIDCQNYHHYFCNDTHWDLFWMHIKGCGILPIYEILYPNGISSISLPDELAFRQLYHNIVSQMQQNDLIAASKTSSEIHAIMHMLLTASYRETASEHTSLHEIIIKKAITFMEQNYEKQISIDEIADYAHVSKYYFIRLFRRHMGVTPYHYLTSFRINQSKLLLRNTSNSIADIALQCGFLDDSNFIAQFKKYTGVKPTKYRKDFTIG